MTIIEVICEHLKEEGFSTACVVLSNDHIDINIAQTHLTIWINDKKMELNVCDYSARIILVYLADLNHPNSIQKLTEFLKKEYLK
jgi:hypothetical protein